MVELAALAVVSLVSCLVVGMYYSIAMARAYEKALREREARERKEQPWLFVKAPKLEEKPKEGLEQESLDLEKIALKELPRQLDKKPKGLLAELYIKKEVYIRKDLAEQQ
ncbi:hypothetical protein AYK26_04230 [Euryarchaeota archaeon SM23-78]|nr:MAG: hypothetical protein AYK26_04230 [Euryarchaeota archaeon SM23-78]MBW3001272.1 hypothetical protein [Candidatus Woesearchaeota archaeon]